MTLVITVALMASAKAIPITPLADQPEWNTESKIVDWDQSLW